MAIELPPPLPPQDLHDAAPLRTAVRSGPTLSFRQYRLHLPAGAPARRRLEDAIAGAETLDEVLTILAKAWYQDGELSAQLVYAVDGDEVYVGAFERSLTALQVPDSVEKYFRPLLGRPLHEAEFEPRRALANVYADRAGLVAQARLEPTADGGLRLDVEPEAEHGPPTDLRVDYGNPGNRFVGRHFLDLDLRQSDRAGDQFKLLWHTALTDIGESSAKRYNEETLTWSRATTLGVWGLTGHAFDYDGHDDREGRLREGQLTWLYPVAGTLNSRFLVEARADYVNRQVESGETELREEYPSLQAGFHYSYSASPRLGPLDLDVGSTFRKGLRGDRAPTGADLDYLLWRPTLNLNLSLGDDWNAGLLVAGQLSGDTLPLESQWVLGGIDNIVAYLPGIAVGDSGGYGALDLQYGGLHLAAVRLTPRAFVEYGLSRYTHSPDGGPNTTARLADAGLELSAAWRWFEASVAAALPLQHRNVPGEIRHDSETNLLFRLTARL